MEGMTVSELVKLLSKYPQDARVVLDGYEGGLDDVVDIATIPLHANANPDIDYYGVHLFDPATPTETAVWIKARRARGNMPSFDELK
jgi:hypothetical protein